MFLHKTAPLSVNFTCQSKTRLIGCRKNPSLAHKAPPLPALRATPSSQTSRTELSLLSTLSTVVPDGWLGEQETAAATVTYSLLVASIKSESLGYRPLENAIAAARTFSKDVDMQVAKAMANVGTMLADKVTGRVSTEIDPRLANDSAGIVAKAKVLEEMYEELGVPKEKLLFRIPATWAGIKSTQELEKAGLACHIYMVYSLPQAVAAAEAGASVINPNVGRTRDFFRKNPNAIRDPHGPRQDAGLEGGPDPGVALAIQIYNYCKVHHSHSAVMATGIRSREDALALAGYDFLVLPPPVLEALDTATTISGYNDGLKASELSEVLPRVVSPEAARAEAPEKLNVNDIMASAQSFEDAMGYSGKELLSAGLASALKDVAALASLSRAASGTE